MTRADAEIDLGDPLHAFTRSTTLHAEHRRLMGGRHKLIRWEETTAASLASRQRERLATLWRERMVAEHRSIGLFALYTLDLLGSGAPAEVLSHATRAALDEVRHTELFGRLASIYSGVEETPPPGIPPMPDDPSVPIQHQAAREALYLSVAAETYSCVSLSAQRGRAIDPVVRQVYDVVLADEIHHARMGWSYLGMLLDDAARGRDALQTYLAPEIVPMFDALVDTMFGPDPASLRDPDLDEGECRLLQGHGYLAPREQWSMFIRVLETVWVPGLHALGFDCAALPARYRKLAPAEGRPVTAPYDDGA